jgi:16S rRNA processing protein RimM
VHAYLAGHAMRSRDDPELDPRNRVVAFGHRPRLLEDVEDGSLVEPSRRRRQQCAHGAGCAAFLADDLTQVVGRHGQLQHDGAVLFDDVHLDCIGVVARPHGVTGELRVHVFNPESTLLQELTEIFLLGEEDEEPALVEIVSTRQGSKALLMRLAGVSSLEDAESLRGYALCVPREVLPDLEEGEYYHADLIGLEAFEGSESIGRVVEVIDYPSAECLKIQRPGGFLEVPMLPRWLDRVDIDGGKVHLKDLDDIPLQKRR